MGKGYINKILFDRRLAKGYDRKTASKLLSMSTLKLKFIECGFIGVNKKYYQRFIDVYQLSPTFFSDNSSYTQDLIIEEKSIIDSDAKRFYAAKPIKWVGLGLMCASVTCVGYGVYSLNKNQIAPRDVWTKEFATFNSEMKKKSTQSWSTFYLDTRYQIEDKDSPVEGVGNVTTLINTYGKDINASDTNFQTNIDNYTGEVSSETPHLVKGSKFSFDLGVYNRRRLLYCSWSNPNKEDIQINNALISIDEEGNYYLLPFQYIDLDKQVKWARITTSIYKEFNKIFPKIASDCFVNLDKILTLKSLGYTKVKNLINDLQIISRDQVYHNRVGVVMTSICAATAILFAIMTGLGFYYYRIRKKKNYIVDEIVPKIEYKNNQFMWKGKKINDIKMGPFIPELVLKIVGLVCLLLFSISMYVFITRFLVSDRPTEINNFRIIGANLMQAAVVLLFFVKMDILSKKNNGSTLFTIILYFLVGLVLYVAEICTFKILDNNESIITVLLNIFNGLIPGNIFFTLGWYTLIYFLLFNNPKGIENNKRKRITFRSCSLIPTTFLVFCMVWQFLIKSKVHASYFVNLLFFSKGALLTIFVIIYLYSLFAYQQACRKKFGNKLCNDIYFNSRRYLLTKNSIASGILLILLTVDIVFGIYLPSNQLKLGKNWAVGIIIPLILLYHPNIDKRVRWWDRIFPFLNFLCLAGGYIAIIIKVLTYMNLGQFIYIIF